MATLSFPVGESPRLVLADCASDITVKAHDERNIVLKLDRDDRAEQQGDDVVVSRASDDLTALVPHDTQLVIQRAHSDVSITGVDGSIWVDLAQSDLILRDVGAVQIEGPVGGDTQVIHAAQFAAKHVRGDLQIAHIGEVSVGTVDGDCQITDVAGRVTCGHVRGDLEIIGSGQDVLVVAGSISGDCEIREAASIELSDIGGDANLSARGDIRLGSVGGDLDARTTQGEIAAGSVGGDAQIMSGTGAVRVASIGGDLDMETTFTATSVAQLVVRGDASLDLRDGSDVTVRATVGGEVHGRKIATTSEGELITATYGEGAGKLDMMVGGDLDLDGKAPRSSSSGWGAWADFGREMGQLGAVLGRDLGRMGAELGRDLGKVLSSQGGVWANRATEQAEQISARIQERLRSAEEEIKRSMDRAARESEQAIRNGERVAMTVRMGDREWRFDEERLDHLKKQAQDAAESGIASAVEAVDRAIAGMGAPRPPAPPAPPAPPMAPVPPAPPAPPMAPLAPVPPAPPAPPMAPLAPVPPAPEEAQAPATGVTMRIDRAEPAEPAAPRDIEAERAAILRMIAEGRISPEEGDLLLEALG